MLYLVLPPETPDWQTVFDTPLTKSGVERAIYMATIFYKLGIEWVYACPAVRCLETIRPYANLRSNTKGYLRKSIEYRLYPAVQAEQEAARQLEWPELKTYHIRPSDPDGLVPVPGETLEQLQRRVIDWFDNIFLENYRLSPIPTAVVADPAVLSILVHHLLCRTPEERETANSIVQEFVPGAVFEFKPNGLRLDYIRRV